MDPILWRVPVASIVAVALSSRIEPTKVPRCFGRAQISAVPVLKAQTEFALFVLSVRPTAGPRSPHE